MTKKIQFYSEKTKKHYLLFSTKTIPTLKISGVAMHRFVRIDPLTDTLLKIKAANPRGIVLDCCAGLGYTAIYSARKKEVKKVFTFEKDENVAELLNINEHSKEIFLNKKIEFKIKDISDAIKEFDREFFDCIIHDPPTFKMAPDLYSSNFFKELYRVLKKKGTLWVYCPKPGKLRGRDKVFLNSIKRKLVNDAGFRFVRYDEASCGFICRK